ncbi:LuxR C-terminal-related transcriptional regulator [Draconibacterium sp.]|nr:LuxR C-terminal-related transcriptional regulator [Draconibacterium sp.]
MKPFMDVKLKNDDNFGTSYSTNNYSVFSNLKHEFSLNGFLKINSVLVEIEGKCMTDLSKNYILFMQDVIHPEDFQKHKKEFLEHAKHYNEHEAFKSYAFRIRYSKKEWLKILFCAIYLFPFKIFGIFQHIINTEEVKPDKRLNISKREEEVLKLIADGDSAKIIGDKLHISENTVVTHRKHLKQKLKVKNTAELVREAFKTRVIL